MGTYLFVGEDEHHMPLFAIVCTKFKRDGVAANDTILEVSVNSEALERMKNVEDTLEAVKSVQVRIGVLGCASHEMCIQN